MMSVSFSINWKTIACAGITAIILTIIKKQDEISIAKITAPIMK